MDTSQAENFVALPSVGVVERTVGCSGCGYDLRGQPVRADSRYGLRLTQCSECGLIVEAPPARKAAFRFAGAGTRGIFAAFLLIGIAGFVGGLAQSTGFAASMDVAHKIGSSAGWRHGSTIFRPVGATWWQTNRDSVMRNADWRWDVLSDLLWLLVVLPPVAILMAILLPSLPTLRLVRFGIYTMIASSIGLLAYYAYPALSRHLIAMTLAEREGGIWFGMAALVAGWLVTVLSFQHARAGARYVLTKLGGVDGGPLSALWTDDGLEPPSQQPHADAAE